MMYGVRITRHYYAPRANETDWARDHRGDRMEFDSRDIARAWIVMVESRVYYTGHGESGRPTMRTRKIEGDR